MVVFLPLTLVATHQLSRARTSKNLPFDLIGLVFGNLDAFVEVDGEEVACKEERKLSARGERLKESKEVEVLPVTEYAERLAPPHHCLSRSSTESALYLHTPNLRQGLRFRRTSFLLSIGLRMFTVRHLGGQNMLISAHDLPSFRLLT